MSFTDMLGNTVEEGDFVAFSSNTRLGVGRLLRVHPSGSVTILLVSSSWGSARSYVTYDIRTNKPIDWWKSDHVIKRGYTDAAGTWHDPEYAWWAEKRFYTKRVVLPRATRIVKWTGPTPVNPEAAGV